MIAKKRNKKHAEEKSLGQVVADKRIKYMCPADITPYTDVPPQAIREGMKAKILDIGFVINPSGKRYSYYIWPQKFFDWLGIPIPIEWQPQC